MTKWLQKKVSLKYQLSDFTIASATLKLECYSANPLDDAPLDLEQLTLPPKEDDSQGFLLHSQPVQPGQAKIRRCQGLIYYLPQQYKHCFINMRQSFEDYKSKFSSKTRSTINRKVKKFAKHSGGTINWKSYKTEQQLAEFFDLAREVSRLTYQEKLLDAGLPDSQEFIQQAICRAKEDGIRAFILFDGQRPVSYLYLPIKDEVLIYAYLGYDPEYMKLSVGTVLQWLAMEELFLEGRFLAFDFTEGESPHKLLFSTDIVSCANIYILHSSFRNSFLVYVHLMLNKFSTWLGNILERWGIKAKIRRFIRFSGK
ncbi:MAG: GNAT family N-acetyltransferase [Parahaliea sp.]